MNKLSTILNNAADMYLDNGVDSDPYSSREVYSCLAAIEAAMKYFKQIDSTSYIWDASVYFENTIMPFFTDLGLILHPEDERDEGEFFEFIKGPERQAARYCWLKFAAMIAEEEGL
jgi:hypothetical protein